MTIVGTIVFGGVVTGDRGEIHILMEESNFVVVVVPDGEVGIELYVKEEGEVFMLLFFRVGKWRRRLRLFFVQLVVFVVVLMLMVDTGGFPSM